MVDAHNALDATGVQAWAVSMHLTLTITWPQGDSAVRNDQWRAAQVHGDVRSHAEVSRTNE
jgi:hypothetical protein